MWLYPWMIILINVNANDAEAILKGRVEFYRIFNSREFFFCRYHIFHWMIYFILVVVSFKLLYRDSLGDFGSLKSYLSVCPWVCVFPTFKALISVTMGRFWWNLMEMFHCIINGTAIAFSFKHICWLGIFPIEYHIFTQ